MSHTEREGEYSCNAHPVHVGLYTGYTTRPKGHRDVDTRKREHAEILYSSYIALVFCNPLLELII